MKEKDSLTAAGRKGGADVPGQGPSKKLLQASDTDGGDFSIQAVTASFIPSAGVLSVFGDALDNNIVVSRNAAGQILINGGAVASWAARRRSPTPR